MCWNLPPPHGGEMSMPSSAMACTAMGFTAGPGDVLALAASHVRAMWLK